MHMVQHTDMQSYFLSQRPGPKVWLVTLQGQQTEGFNSELTPGNLGLW